MKSLRLLDEGIVNFHPGPIPQTSGLDAFYYSIKTRADAGVTTHFIDARVDAGQQIYFDPVELHTHDTPESVLEKTYLLQIIALRRFLSERSNNTLVSEPVDRPTKNKPMVLEEKQAMLDQFQAWKAYRIGVQVQAKFHTCCRQGDTDSVLALLENCPSLLEVRTKEGWTPLILAAFAQHGELVEVLLERGANPNATGLKGTTALMYAKTALLDEENPDTAILDSLIKAGADPMRCDMHGKTVH